jgi:hypothetical protein
MKLSWCDVSSMALIGQVFRDATIRHMRLRGTLWGSFPRYPCQGKNAPEPRRTPRSTMTPVMFTAIASPVAVD